MTNNCCKFLDYSDPSKNRKTAIMSWKDCRPCNEIIVRPMNSGTRAMPNT